jgi:hypothetical protein
MKMQVNALRTPLPPMKLKRSRSWGLVLKSGMTGAGNNALDQGVVLGTEITGNDWMSFLESQCIISRAEKTAVRRWENRLAVGASPAMSWARS